jgi:ankyrin repeat protein
MQPTIRIAAVTCISLLTASALQCASTSKPGATTRKADAPKMITNPVLPPSQSLYNLVQAVRSGNVEAAQNAIVVQKASINGQGNMIPLHEAAQQGNQMMIQLLLNLGANANQQDNDHHTALFWTIWAIKPTSTAQQKQNALAIVTLLLQKGAGASVNVKAQSTNQTPYDMAVANKLTDLANLMKPYKK